MAIYVPIIMYGLRLFVVVLQELHCLPLYYSVLQSFVPRFSPVFEIRELKI